MRLIFITLVLFVGSILKVEAMKVEDQELVAVSMYKKACEVGLVSQKAMQCVRNMPRQSVYFQTSPKKDSLGIAFRENYVHIDLDYLFVNAVINSWVEAVERGQLYNQYFDFLVANKVSEYDVGALYQVLNTVRAVGVNIHEMVPYMTKMGSINIFKEIVADHLKSQGVRKTFYRVSKKNFDRILAIKDLVNERNTVIDEFRSKMDFVNSKKKIKRFVTENWLKNLHQDALKCGAISRDEQNCIAKINGRIGINPAKILTSAMIRLVDREPELYEFLVKYGVRSLNIIRMNTVVRSFLNPYESKIVRLPSGGSKISEIFIPNLDDLHYIFQTISDDLNKIGVENKIYYIPVEMINLH